MFKGTAEIVLTKNDGTQRKITENNMFTNAIENILTPPSWWFALESSSGVNGANFSGYLKGVLPIYKNLLGGIMLFENPLEENVDNIFPPISNNNLGYAGNTANANKDNNCLGSYNEYESGIQDDGSYTHCWEWNTSQTTRRNGVDSKVFWGKTPPS